ncbi:hypothetical protein GEMRC1_004700 [Eukaryota sp. GEM-RC1]
MHLLLGLLLITLSCAIVVKDLDRQIDLSTPHPRVDVSLNVFNNEGKEVSKLEYIVSSVHGATRSSVLSCSVNDKPVTCHLSDNTLTVDMEPLSPKSSAKISLSYVCMDAVTVVPEEIKQGDEQYVQLIESSVVPSPYTIERQRTSLKCASVADNGIMSGADSNQLSFSPTSDESSAPLNAICTAPYPIVIGTTERTFTLEPLLGGFYHDEFDLSNKGSRLVGEWSRLDHQRKPNDAKTAMSLISMRLIPFTNPHSLVYRDYIGNISTSQYTQLSESETHFTVAPRFPLFGGWNFKFFIKGAISRMYFKQMMLTKEARVPVFPQLENVFFTHAKTTIVLPQFAKIIGFNSQVINARCYKGPTVMSHLDIVGRETFVCEVDNVATTTPLGDIVVKFSYSGVLDFMKPLLIVAFVAVVVFGIKLAKRIAKLFVVKNKVE